MIAVPLLFSVRPFSVPLTSSMPPLASSEPLPKTAPSQWNVPLTMKLSVPVSVPGRPFVWSGAEELHGGQRQRRRHGRAEVGGAVKHVEFANADHWSEEVHGAPLQIGAPAGVSYRALPMRRRCCTGRRPDPPGCLTWE